MTYHLHEETLLLVKEERRLTGLIIENLQKISDERLFLKMGFSSLFDYCTKGLGYAESCAYRRISAVRMAREIPEIKNRLDQGSLTLTTVSLCQSFFRASDLSTDEKRDILKTVEHKTRLETEKILAARLGSNAAINLREKIRPLSGTKTRVQLDVGNELIEKLNKIKSLRSHKNPNMNYEELLNDMADFVLAKIDRERRIPAKGADNETQTPKANHAHATPSKKPNLTPSKYQRYIPSPTKRAVWQRDQGRCTYTDPRTGKKCDSTYLVQFDHIQPIRAGGGSSPDNLRLLCCAHNQMRERSSVK